MRRLPAFLTLSSLSVCCFLAACDDSSLVFPEDRNPIEPTDVLVQFPSPRSTNVQLDREVYLVFDRPLSDLEISRIAFFVNDERVLDFVHDRWESSSRVRLVPAGELEYHRYYNVRVTSAESTGIENVEWSFATGPGPEGLLWQRADAPAVIDLLSVVDIGSGFRAAGRDGVVVNSPYLFGWLESTGGVGVAGSAQSEDIVSFWPGTRSAVLTATGMIYVGGGVHDWMAIWEAPENLWVRAMWDITAVLVGSLRDDPNVGFLTSSYPGDLTLTRPGQVMRAVSHAYDGGGLYLAVGDAGSIYSSRDRIEWEEVCDRPDWGSLEAVIAGYDNVAPNSQVPLVSVAAGSTIVWSADGRSWQQAGLPPTAGVIHDLAWDGHPVGEYLAVGENGTILRSTDGQLWSKVDTGHDLSGLTFRAMTVGRSRWVVVGDDGVTLVSPPNALGF